MTRTKKARKQAPPAAPPEAPDARFADRVLDADRADAVLEAARKIEILAEALVTHSDCAEKFEDIKAVASIVSSVARRQEKLARVIIRALDGSTVSSIDLGSEAHFG
jgi:hypothetical protein